MEITAAQGASLSSFPAEQNAQPLLFLQAEAWSPAALLCQGESWRSPGATALARGSVLLSLLSEG